MGYWKRVVYVLLIITSATLFQFLFWSWLEPFAWLILFPAVFISSLVDGLRGALLSTIICAFIGVFFFIDPENSFQIGTVSDYFPLISFIILGIIVGLVSEYLSSLERKLKKHNEELTLTVDNLRSSEQRLKYHLENSPLAVIEWNTKYEITQWSKRAESMFGWRSGETIGKNINSLNLIFEEDLPILQRTIERLSGGRELTVVSSNRNYTKDGKVIECTWYNSVLLGDHGEMVSVMSLVQDITEHKRVLDELQSSEKALKEAQQRLNIALENANIGTWEMHLDSGELFLDHRAGKMFGLRAGASGKRIKNITRIINEEDVEHFSNALENAARHDLPFATIFRLRKSGNQTKFINLRGLIVKENAVAKQISGVCFDVTELKLGTEMLVSRLNEDLLRSNADLQQFAYVASHDLQEPLRMVSSFTQLLQQRYKDKLDVNANEYINYAVEGSRRMYDLVNGLLSYSRIRTRENDYSNVDMNSVMKQIVDIYRLVIEEKGAEIKYSGLPVIHADQNQILQLMQNLIGNSLKFTDTRPVVEVESVKDEYYDIISIKDNGIGIDPRYYEKIFKIFQKLHSNTEFSGTGIGLAICKRIVERHKGKIWIESIPGQGATFFFSIPKSFRMPGQ